VTFLFFVAIWEVIFEEYLENGLLSTVNLIDRDPEAEEEKRGHYIPACYAVNFYDLPSTIAFPVQHKHKLFNPIHHLVK